MTLPKLVRDKIPEIIEEHGRTCSFRKAEDSEIKKLLLEKLIEETEEFLEKPSLEEAADIYEVFLSMLNNWNLDFQSVVNHAYYKREKNGSFSRRVILENVEQIE